MNISWDFRLRRLATVLSVAILTLSLLAAITGILLGFYYQPTAGGAYYSLTKITNDVPFGWLIRSLHNMAANLLIVFGLIQLVVMFLDSRFGVIFRSLGGNSRTTNRPLVALVGCSRKYAFVV